jgi:hypothetical protein
MIFRVGFSLDRTKLRMLPQMLVRHDIEVSVDGTVFYYAKRADGVTESTALRAAADLGQSRAS